jgi:hypothetical protein
MLLTLALSLFLGYEIQKLIQFNFFLRIKSLSSDYYSQLVTRVNSVAFKELLKISIFDALYLITIVICLFTYNLYFAFIIILLSVAQHLIFKITKSKFIRMTTHAVDSVLSIFALLLSIINIFYYQTNGIELIKKLTHALFN